MQDNEPYIITKRKSVRKIYFGRIIAVICVLCLIGIAAVIWFCRVSGKITVEARDYWAVSVYNGTSEADAQAKSQSVASSGGAGYTYGSNPYKVMVCCYVEKEQAQTVGNRLAAQGEQVEYVKISCPAISVDKPKSDGKKLENMLVAPHELFGELYDVFLKTDSGEITESAAQYAAYKMRETCSDYYNYSITLKSAVGDFLAEVFTELGQAFTELSSAKADVSQKVKYTLCKIADIISNKSAQFVK